MAGVFNDDIWFRSGKKLGWSKDDTQATRRRNALKSRKGNYLKAARALMALANVTRDVDTKRKSRADSLYFYQMNKRNQKQKR